MWRHVDASNQEYKGRPILLSPTRADRSPRLSPYRRHEMTLGKRVKKAKDNRGVQDLSEIKCGRAGTAPQGQHRPADGA